MEPLPISRALSAQELKSVEDNTSKIQAILQNVRCFVPIPDGRNMSGMGDKTVAYVNNAFGILEANQSQLNTFMDLCETRSTTEK